MNASEKLLKAQQMVDTISDLPTIPIVASKVLELLDKPDCELDEVADMILTDQVLAARVIKIVNSPLYRSAHEITSVKRALIFLLCHRVRAAHD
jgi:HD-like signal output (HDOD) protein